MPFTENTTAEMHKAIERAKAGEAVSFTCAHEDQRRECIDYFRRRGCVDSDTAWRVLIGTGSITLDARTA
jgi:hypothetical protein